MTQAQLKMFSQTKARARRTDPETSHEAAASVTDLNEKQSMVKKVMLWHGAMTDHEIYKRLQEHGFLMSRSGARTRRSELVEIGQAKYTGKKKKLPTGRRARIWALI